jgi:hypothetical protein
MIYTEEQKWNVLSNEEHCSHLHPPNSLSPITIIWLAHIHTSTHSLTSIRSTLFNSPYSFTPLFYSSCSPYFLCTHWIANGHVYRYRHCQLLEKDSVIVPTSVSVSLRRLKALRKFERVATTVTTKTQTPQPCTTNQPTQYHPVHTYTWKLHNEIFTIVL